MALTDTMLRGLKPGPKPQKLSDGGGLFLLVTPSGGRLWRLAYRFDGKQKQLAFGSYPEIGLKRAREKRDAAKALLAEGIDPAEQARRDRAVQQAASANTFSLLADEYLAKLEREGRAPATLAKVTWLLSLARPALGERPIAEITPPEVLQVLKKIEATGRLETARKLQTYIGTVFRYAMATLRATSDPTVALKGALSTPVVKNRAAIIDPEELGAFLRAIEGYQGQPSTFYALQLLPYLFVRPGELRRAEWAEFDLDAAVWVIPAERTKMRRPHRHPLARQPLALLAALQRITGDGRPLFPSARSAQRPISENTLNAAMRRLGYGKDEVTAHGFRATASTLLNESGLWHPDAIERALAHVEQSSVRRAYARGEHWDERVRMMQWWADELDRLRAGGSTKDRIAKRA
jgi:integrase